MKVLIPIVIGLLVVGCGEKQSTNTNDGNSAPEESAKKLTAEEKALRDSVVGTYELNADGDTHKQVFLKNGTSGGNFGFGLVEIDHLWTIVKGEIIEKSDSTGWVWIKNKDGSVTNIADIDPEGKRKDLPKKSNHLRTYKNIE